MKLHTFFSRYIFDSFPGCSFLSVHQQPKCSTPSLRGALRVLLPFLLEGLIYRCSLDKYRSFLKFFGSPGIQPFSQIYGELANPLVARKVLEFNAEVVFVLGGKIIPPELYSSCFSVHLHCGLLPWYRGGATWLSNFLTRDFHGLGFSLQALGDGIDTGEVYDQFRIDLKDSDTPWSSYCKCVVAGSSAAVELVKMYLARPSSVSSTKPASGFLHTGRFLYDKRRLRRLRFSAKRRSFSLLASLRFSNPLLVNNLSAFSHVYISS